MKKILLSLTFYLIPLACLAVAPTDYYSSIDGKTGEAILDALHKVIDGHTSISYSALEPYYAQTDLTAEGYIWDMYSLCNFTMAKANGGNSSVCASWNKEHSVPQSYFKEASPMKSDLFHVYPTDSRVNNFRSNYPYGETSSRDYIDKSKNALGHIGSSNFTGYSGKVYEPDDEYKGDFARTYFYMVARYLTTNFTQSENGTVTFTYSNKRAGLTDYGVRLMLKWHRQDPVSQKEIRRNDAVYNIQHNRNPFIDYPCLVEYIWGDSKTEQLDLNAIMLTSDEAYEESDHTGCNCLLDQPTLLTPKKNASIIVGSASVGESVYQDIYVSGVLLTKALSVTLSGTNAAMFALHTASLPAANANAGCTLRVIYTPTATGSHSATLTIQSSEIAAREIKLSGESKAELVTPVTQSEFSFVAEGIRDTIRQTIHVKSTNLTQGIYVGLSKAGNGIFSVSPASLTKAEANAGADIVVTYTPSAIGTSTANLILNSLGGEFTQPTIKLNGSCVFQLRPVSNLSSTSATLNWVDAGVEKYEVDVFILTQVEEKEVLILDDAAGASASKEEYYDTDTKGYIRLGSGKKGGSMTYSGLDLSKGANVVITAKAYNSTDNPTMKVTINDSTYSFKPTTSDADYTIQVYPGASALSTIKIESLSSNQRFLVKNVRVVAGGVKEQRDHVFGYPCMETNLSHTVTDLLPDVEYSYAITPYGMEESSIETFMTNYTSDLDIVRHSDNDTYKTIDASGHLVLHCLGHTYSATGTILR